MLEVCERFHMTIADYRALSIGERLLYNQYTMIKIDAESRSPAIKLKGG